MEPVFSRSRTKKNYEKIQIQACFRISTKKFNSLEQCSVFTVLFLDMLFIAAHLFRQSRKGTLKRMKSNIFCLIHVCGIVPIFFGGSYFQQTADVETSPRGKRIGGWLVFWKKKHANVSSGSNRKEEKKEKSFCLCNYCWSEKCWLNKRKIK